MKHKTWFVLGMIVCLMVLLGGVNVQAWAVALYVVPGGTGDGDCGDWDNACDLQTALVSVAGLSVGPGDVVEILVAAGTYKPISGTDRTATFQLIDGVKIYGGYDSTSGDRDWDLYETILSGDLKGDDGPDFANRSDNSYNVVTVDSGITAAAVLDGFTIIGGYADTPGISPSDSGSGLRISLSNPTLANLIFRDNYAYWAGGGLFIDHGGSQLTNVKFEFNKAGDGAGMYIIGSGFETTSPILTDVEFNNNSASFTGGGLYNFASSPKLVDVRFDSNMADLGGGMGNDDECFPELTRVIFNGNRARSDGGGMYFQDSAPILTEVHLELNTAGGKGGGIYFTGRDPILDYVYIKMNEAIYGGGIYINNSDPVMTNVTFTSNTASTSGGGIYSDSGNLTLTDASFYLNNANSMGGGIYAQASSPTLDKITFIGNNADDAGGGIAALGSSPTLTNVIFSGNTTQAWGGGIYFFEGTRTSPQLTNVSFSGNSANYGGGFATSGNVYPDLTNSILWGNIATTSGDQVYDLGSSPPGISNSIVQGGCPVSPGVSCTNVLDSDPFFIDPDGADNTPGTTDDNLRLSVVSPAIDAGDNAVVSVSQDLDNNPRIVNGTVDLGAYESQVHLANTSWPKAYRLELDPLLDVQEANVDHPIDALGQSRWYKFSVQPGSRVVVRLGNLAANYDVTLYKDIQVAFDALTQPQNLDDLTELTAEFAPDAYAPDAYAPDAYAPDAYAPDAYAPDAYAPDAYAPDAYAPDAYAPDAYAPDAYAPDAYAPDAYAPDLAYTSAQSSSLIGVSAADGKASEFIAVNTWDNTGDFYVRVKGRNSAFDPGSPFHLKVTQLVGNCKNLGVQSPVKFTTTDTGGYIDGYNTIILTDMGRMNLTTGEQTALQDRLEDLALRPEVKGVVFDVGTDGDVSSANTEADMQDNLQCPYAKNLVAMGIRDIINGYRIQNPDLEYVVIVGNDDVIPFFRYPDRALLASEKNFEPPVKDDTTSYASLNLGYVLSQDFYGATRELSLSNTTLPLPHLAVGRLVENYSDIVTMLDAYQADADGIVVPSSALVTGYDFLQDAAEAIQVELENGIGNNYTADALIADSQYSPFDEQNPAWTAEQLSTLLLEERHDLIFLAGHFSASSALAADYQTRLLAPDVASSQTADLANAIVFSAGCHAGYNIVNSHGIQNLTREPDWAQAFAQQGAALIAGTGYQYGDTDFLEYSERLYLYFSQELRTGSGAVPIGKALVRAKQEYLATTPELRGIHEKALLETTLFGLPMLSVDMPNGRGIPPVPASIVPTPLDGYVEDPAYTLGLKFADISIGSSLTPGLVTLKSVNSTATIDARYFSGGDGVVANPAEPVLPLELRNVSVDNMVLRGTGFLGGCYSDLTGIIPLTSAVATEVRGVHPPFQSEVFFPIRPWHVNYFNVLTDPAGGITRLALTPAQFKSDGDANLYTGTVRRFDAMDFRLFYSDHTSAFQGGSVPSMAAPPSIAKVLAAGNGTQVDFQVAVLGDPSAGVQEVWVTYTPGQGNPNCGGETWETLFLTQNVDDSRLWDGSLTLPAGTTAENLRFIVQAVNGVGLVTVNTNLGHYFTPNIDPGAPPVTGEPTTLSLDLPQNSGAYNTILTVNANLFSNGSPVDDKTITFALGSQKRSAKTDVSGVATISVPLLAPPGDYLVRASFEGTTEYQGTMDTSDITITKQVTELVLSLDSQIIGVNSSATLFLKLTDSLGRPLREKTIFLIVSDNDSSYEYVDKTNFLGESKLIIDDLPAGVYTVKAYFSGAIPLQEPLLLVDPNYDASLDVFRYLVVYEPYGGFVTGGGWIVSPEGACVEFCGNVTGKANFGFVSKYKKGAATPSGNTQFQLKAGGLKFKSSSYDWLVVAGSKAMYKGVGTIKGEDGQYGFLISVIDADFNQNDGHDIDRFRIIIWDVDTGVVIYDNQVAGDPDEDANPTTAIGGGSITIHKAKKR